MEWKAVAKQLRDEGYNVTNKQVHEVFKSPDLHASSTEELAELLKLTKGETTVIRTVAEFYKHKAGMISVFKTLPADSIALWSGQTEVAAGTPNARQSSRDGKWYFSGWENAMKVAKSKGLGTLESTLIDNGIELPEYSSDPEVDRIWREVSKLLATFAISDDFFVIAGADVRATAVVHDELEKLSVGHEAKIIDNLTGEPAAASHPLAGKAGALARNKTRRKAPLDTGLHKP